MKQCDILEKQDAACDADEELILKNLKGRAVLCSSKGVEQKPLEPRLPGSPVCCTQRGQCAFSSLLQRNLETGDEGQGHLEPKTLVLPVNTRTSPFKCCSQGAPRVRSLPSLCLPGKGKGDLWHRSLAGWGVTQFGQHTARMSPTDRVVFPLRAYGLSQSAPVP